MYSITHSLNIILTLMIVIRLITHARRFRNTTGQSCGVYSAIATILVESCVLYTITILLCFIPIVAHSSVEDLFSTGCTAAQVCAGFTFSPSIKTLTTINRSSLHSSSFCEWQTGPHSYRVWQRRGAAARFITTANGDRGVAALLVFPLQAQWT